MSNYYNEQLKQIEKRLEKYWNGDTIDVDLANKITDDCYALIGEVRELKATLKASNNSLTDYIVFQNIVENSMSQHDFYQLLGQWQQKLSEQRVAP